MSKRLGIFLIASLLFLAAADSALASGILRMGILPVPDTLPLQAAQADGLFKAQGLEVELVPFASAMERDVAMQSGRLDGYFGDIVNTLLLIQAGVPMRMVTVSYSTTPGQRMFAVVTSPDPEAGIESTIGISRTTIIEYLLETMGREQKLPVDKWEVVDVKKLPIRMQMLLTGQLGMALMPEPLVSLVEARGGRILATDENLDMPLTVLCIRDDKLGGGTLEAFLAAYAKAVAAINADPERYRELMVATCRIPKDLARGFPVYRFPEPKLPKPEAVNRVQAWMLEKGLLENRLPWRRLTAEPAQ